MARAAGASQVYRMLAPVSSRIGPIRGARVWLFALLLRVISTVPAPLFIGSTLEFLNGKHGRIRLTQLGAGSYVLHADGFERTGNAKEWQPVKMDQDRTLTITGTAR